MGAAFFTNTNTYHPDDLSKAFRQEVEGALYDYGHRGYTGTIAEKHDVVEVGEAETFEAARELVNEWEAWEFDGGSKWDSEKQEYVETPKPKANPLPWATDDKWGPANAIRVPGEGWLFFGWASS